MLSDLRWIYRWNIFKVKKQNYLLREILKINKSRNISFSVQQTINIKHGLLESYLTNKHCDVTEHHIDRPRLFRNSDFFKKFVDDHLPILENRVFKML